MGAQDLQIKADFLRQFIDNQRKLGAAAENLPSNPMKYVDASVLEASRGA